MKTKLFEEIQRGLMAVLAVAIAVTAIFSVIAIVEAYKATGITWVAVLPTAFALVILGVTLAIFSKMVVTLDGEMLRFGFPPFVIKVPVDKVTRIAQSKAGFGRTFGIGIRYMIDGRILYNTFWGNIIEVDFAGRRYAFSCRNPEKFIEAFKTLRPDIA